MSRGWWIPCLPESKMVGYPTCYTTLFSELWLLPWGDPCGIFDSDWFFLRWEIELLVLKEDVLVPPCLTGSLQSLQIASLLSAGHNSQYCQATDMMWTSCFVSSQPPLKPFCCNTHIAWCCALMLFDDIKWDEEIKYCYLPFSNARKFDNSFFGMTTKFVRNVLKSHIFTIVFTVAGHWSWLQLAVFVLLLRHKNIKVFIFSVGIKQLKNNLVSLMVTVIFPQSQEEVADTKSCMSWQSGYFCLINVRHHGGPPLKPTALIWVVIVLAFHQICRVETPRPSAAALIPSVTARSTAFHLKTASNAFFHSAFSVLR